MREILFRGKIKYGKGWILGDLLHGAFSNCIFVNGLEVIPETVGQYIGLKDKNGKKIFEGDIILTNHEDEIEISNYMGWNCGCCSSVYGWDLDEIRDTEECEIIGNIHDKTDTIGDSYYCQFCNTIIPEGDHVCARCRKGAE